MGYKRAEWHSGFTYKQTCHNCGTNVEYTDYDLGFRPWYADGFVYCPKCKTPLRHNENYAINNPNMVSVPEVSVPDPVPAAPSAPAQGSGFCTGCGSPFGEGDCFCAKCGKKR